MSTTDIYQNVAFILKIDFPSYDYFSVLRDLRLYSLVDQRVERNKLFLPKVINNDIDASELLSKINCYVSLRNSRRL